MSNPSATEDPAAERSLPAKLAPPSLDEHVPRPRLLAKLDATVRGHLVWVHGPAGAGKSALLASYLSTRAQHGVWLEVDASDRDLSSFFLHLRLGFEHACGRRITLPTRPPGSVQNVDAFARRQWQTLFAHGASDVCVVLDNEQEASHEPEWEGALCALVEVLPALARVLVSSRRPPPAALRERYDGQTLEVLSFDDLRFDHAEVRALLEARGGRTHLADDAHGLMRATEGWAMAVSLLASAVPEAPRVRDPRMNLIFDYLAGEIFANLPLATRETLVRTAALPHFTLAQAEALSAHPDAAERLLAFARETPLLERHGTASYRLHDLFRTFLLQPQQQRYRESPGAQRAMQARAAELCIEDGAVDLALGLLAEAGSWDELATLLQVHARDLIGQGRSGTLSTSLRRLPEAILETHPWLLIWSTVAAIGRDPAAARYAERAFAQFAAAADVLGQFAAWSTIMQALVMSGAGLGEVAAWMERRRSLPASVPDDALATQVALSELAAWPLLNEPPQRTSVERALAQVEQFAGPSERVLAAGSGAMLHLFRGDAAYANAARELGRRHLPEASNDPLARLVFLQGEVFVTAIGGRYDEAVRLIDEGLLLAQREGIALYNGEMLGVATSYALAREDLEATVPLITRMSAELRSPRDYCNHACLRVWEAIEREDAAGVAYWMTERRRLLSDYGWHFDRLQGPLALLYATARGVRTGSLAEAAEEVEAVVREMRWPLSIGQASLHLVYAKLCAGVLGSEELRERLECARASGAYGMLFLGRTLVRRIAAAALPQGIEVEYVRALLRTCGLDAAEVALPALASETSGTSAWLLGRQEIRRHGQLVSFSRKLPTVPLAMLKLLAASPRPVPVQDLQAALWPALSADRARGAMDMAVHRLRKLLGEHVIALRQGAVWLVEGACWTDLQAFGRLCDEIEACAARSSPCSDADLNALERELDRLYLGPLADEGDPAALVRIGQQVERRRARATADLATLRERSRSPRIGADDRSLERHR